MGMTPLQVKQYRAYLVASLVELRDAPLQVALDLITTIDSGAFVCPCGRQRDHKGDPLCMECRKMLDTVVQGV